MPKSFTKLTGSSLAIAIAVAGAPAYGQADVRAEADAKAREVVGKLTMDEKVAQLLNVAPAIPRLDIPAYNWWTESLHGAMGAVPTTNFPEPIGLAATFDAPLVRRVAQVISTEVQRAAYAGSPDRASRADRHRARHLVAQHQHLPRSALGPGAGDLWRGPVPDRADRRRLRQRHPGRQSRSARRRRDTEAFRGPQRAGTEPACRQHLSVAARPGGHLPARVPRRHRRGQGGVDHVRLQPRLRPVGLRQPAAAARLPARRMGLQRLCRVRLRRGGRHLRTSQIRARCRDRRRRGADPRRRQ